MLLILKVLCDASDASFQGNSNGGSPSARKLSTPCAPGREPYQFEASKIHEPFFTEKNLTGLIRKKVSICLGM